MARAARQRIRDAAATAREVGIGADDSAPPNDFGLPQGCPVVPLGMLGMARHYLDEARQLVSLDARDHTRNNLVALFGAKQDYVFGQKRWLRIKDDGTISGIRPERIADDLMQASARAGIWDPAERVRGRGAWRGPNDELILHVGDRVLTFLPRSDAWAGRAEDQPGVLALPGDPARYVYPSGERTSRVGEDAGDGSADEVRDILETWNWRRPDIDPILLLGWIGAAMIGGALKWRPSIWFTGTKGTGKSTLQGAVAHLIGSCLTLADTTAAGVWQTVRHQTLPVLVDELEADADNRRALAVVQLARLSASGGRMARGSDRHQAQEFILRACFAFSSVLMPPLLGTDRSRLAILELAEMAPGAAMPDLAPARLRALHQRLLRRMVDGWHRLDSTIEIYRRALSSVGHSARGADQFGTLLGCADVLLFDGQPTADSVAAWIGQMDAADIHETAEDVRDEDACWQHLLGTPLDAQRGGERFNVGVWLGRALGRYGHDLAEEAQRVISAHGITVRRRLGEPVVIAVANSHRGLGLLFEKTRWSGGVWRQALQRLPDASRSQQAIYFGGATSKATLLPDRLVPEDEAPRQQPLI